MSIFNHLIGIGGRGLCIASLFFMAMSCDLFSRLADDKTKPKTWGVTTLAGSIQGYENGTGEEAEFDEPAGLALSEDERTLYIADRGNHCIRKLDIASRVVSTLAGECNPARRGTLNGIGTAARFENPEHLAFHGGTLYVAGSASENGVRRIDVRTAEVSPLGLPRNSFDSTSFSGLAVKPDGSRLYFLDPRNGRIREINLAADPKTLRTLVGTDVMGDIGPVDGGPGGTAPVDGLCFGVVPAKTDGTCPVALFNQPKGMAISPDGQAIVIADDPMNTHVIRLVSTQNGLTLNTKFNLTSGRSAKAGLVNVQGKTYIVDGAANRIQLMDASGIRIFAGNGDAESRDGSLPDSNFHQPEAITANREGDRIYVADTGGNKIRMIAFK